MSVVDRVLASVGIRRARAADAAYSSGSESDMAKWRPLGRAKSRDLPSFSLAAAQDDSADAYRRFATGRRAVAITAGFAVGANMIRPIAKNPRVQEALNRFWDDPRNRLEDRVLELVTDLSIYGELGLICATGSGSRMTRIGVLDVGRVADVLTDPEDAGYLLAVVAHGARNELRLHPAISRDATIPEAYRGLAIGASVEGYGSNGERITAVLAQPILWTRINSSASAARGIPDSYPALDAMALRDHGLWSFSQRSATIGAFVWDLTVPGGNKERIEVETKAAAAIIGNASGAVYGHSPGIALEPKAPKLDSADFKEAMRLPLQELLTAYGHPEHWYAGGPEMSNASAGEMGSPVWNALQTRQNVVRRMLRTLGDYALAQIPEIRSMSAEERVWDVSLPVILGKDQVREVTILNQEITAIERAVDLGLSREAAQREMQARMNEYGYAVADGDWTEDVIRSLPMPGAPMRVDQSSTPTTDVGVRPNGDPADTRPVATSGSEGHNGGGRAA